MVEWTNKWYVSHGRTTIHRVRNVAYQIAGYDGLQLESLRCRWRVVEVVLCRWSGESAHGDRVDTALRLSWGRHANSATTSHCSTLKWLWTFRTQVSGRVAPLHSPHGGKVVFYAVLTLARWSSTILDTSPISSIRLVSSIRWITTKLRVERLV